MRTRTPLLLLPAVLLLASGCSSGTGSGAARPPDRALAVPTPPQAGDFVRVVDNPWMPWRVGTTWRFVGDTAEGTEHSVVTVTGRTKVVAGVTTTVVHDVVRRGGRLIEDTDDWYAQDRDGTVWYFGEATTAYAADGTADTRGSWQAGVDGAHAGIAMLAHPRTGRSYRQEYLPGRAEDQARVVGTGRALTVPFGRLTGLLETRDSTRLEPDADERKLYARGVGVVLEDGLHEQDRTVLVSMTGP